MYLAQVFVQIKFAGERAITVLNATREEFNLYVLGEEMVYAFLQCCLEIASWPAAIVVLHSTL